MVEMATIFCAMHGYAWFPLFAESSIQLDVRSGPRFLKIRPGQLLRSLHM